MADKDATNTRNPKWLTAPIVASDRKTLWWEMAMCAAEHIHANDWVCDMVGATEQVASVIHNAMREARNIERRGLGF